MVTELHYKNNFTNELCKPVQAKLSFTKRIFDIIFSSAVLFFGAPVYLLIGLLIKIYSPEGSVFFAHKRIGIKRKEFNCYKFRTMVPNAEKKLKNLLEQNPELKVEFEKNFKFKNDPRIIPFIGHFLRKTSLDELPQFFNVLIGEMSVVGPRPIVEDEVKKYGFSTNCLFSVKPGITGLWQISGRNDTSYDSRILLDMNYIRTGNFLDDLKIIFQTVFVMFNKKGAY